MNKNKKKKLISTLQSKIIVTTFLMQIIVSSLAGLFLFYNSKTILIENLKQESINLISPFQIAALDKLENIKEINDQKTYLNIIFDLQGEILFTTLKKRMQNLNEVYVYTDRQTIHSVDKEPLLIFPRLQKALHQKTPSIFFSNKFLYVNIPIQLNDTPIGGIILEYTKNKINNEKRKAFFVSIAMALITFFLSLCLIKLFASIITKPLQKLVNDLDEIIKSGDITEPLYECSKLKNSEFEPLINGYMQMKETAAQQINTLNNEINKRKIAEKECSLTQKNLLETIDEKSEAIKEINILLKDEYSRRIKAEKTTKAYNGILDSLLQAEYCDGVLVLSQNGDVIKSNTRLSIDWDLPETVINDDTEDQLIKYFSIQIVNSKGFLTKYKKCTDTNCNIGLFELKDGRKVNIHFSPLMQELKVVGKILTFHFS